MSIVTGLLLRRSYSATTHATPQHVIIQSLCDEIFETRDLVKLAEKFKLASYYDRFRNKKNVYEHTVQRLVTGKRYKLIGEILEHQTQFTSDISKENFTIRLIKLYGQAGMLRCAKNMFDKMPERKCQRTVSSVNALLSACIDSRKVNEMEKIFREMQTKWSVKPNGISYNTAIKGFCILGKFETAFDIVDEMAKNDVNPNIITFNTLLHYLYKNQKFYLAEKIWEQLVEYDLSPNSRSYNSKLWGLVEQKKLDEAVEAISEMRASEMNPDLYSYAALVRGFCEAKNVVEVKKWYLEMVGNEFLPNKALFVDVLTCAHENGDYDWCFELCKELFERKLNVDCDVLQKIVDALVLNSKVEEAKKVVEMGKSNDFCLYKFELAKEN